MCVFPLAAAGQPCGGVVGHWAFEDAGSVVADWSGLGNHGVAFGSPVRTAGVSGQGLVLDGLDAFVDAFEAGC